MTKNSSITQEYGKNDVKNMKYGGNIQEKTSGKRKYFLNLTNKYVKHIRAILFYNWFQQNSSFRYKFWIQL